MYLIELYKSVQGESSFAGLPCIFVRFAGCNLRCAWCDSEYTFTGGKPFTQAEVIAQDRIAWRPANWWSSPAANPCCRPKSCFR